jgi:hypothetical protein
VLPRVHLVVSLLKRWLVGTHPGAVSPSISPTIWMSSHSGSTGGDRRAAASCSFGFTFWGKTRSSRTLRSTLTLWNTARRGGFNQLP